MEIEQGEGTHAHLISEGERERDWARAEWKGHRQRVLPYVLDRTNRRETRQEVLNTHSLPLGTIVSSLGKETSNAGRWGWAQSGHEHIID